MTGEKKVVIIAGPNGGGHDVPLHVVRRRFASGWRNLHDLYRSRVDCWQLFDNSGSVPLLIEEGTNT